eukprot:TRINITY_DN77619_c0_g1_i1.p1 TRINITY_DN77619_c0_g1~~TRINITY_DN77619_c0_g1_i1.p1  ORF type:complete len:435 (-),score=75.18 TRINITY_DN77619_c0_g1_i1:13-1317(-)
MASKRGSGTVNRRVKPSPVPCMGHTAAGSFTLPVELAAQIVLVECYGSIHSAWSALLRNPDTSGAQDGAGLLDRQAFFRGLRTAGLLVSDGDMFRLLWRRSGSVKDSIDYAAFCKCFGSSRRLDCMSTRDLARSEIPSGSGRAHGHDRRASSAGSSGKTRRAWTPVRTSKPWFADTSAPAQRDQALTGKQGWSDSSSLQLSLLRFASKPSAVPPKRSTAVRASRATSTGLQRWKGLPHISFDSLVHALQDCGIHCSSSEILREVFACAQQATCAQQRSELFRAGLGPDAQHALLALPQEIKDKLPPEDILPLPPEPGHLAECGELRKQLQAALATAIAEASQLRWGQIVSREVSLSSDSPVMLYLSNELHAAWAEMHGNQRAEEVLDEIRQPLPEGLMSLGMYFELYGQIPAPAPLRDGLDTLPELAALPVLVT